MIGLTYHLMLELEGSSIRGYIDGELVVEATHSGPTSGRAGLYANAGEKRFDNLIVRELPCS